ncbi:MAG: UDP-N-acetylmuramate dehydrogenase [Acidimicrobiales bacterium]|nr:UDP-N-acetylmuramate dehydrogenase [Acidimicrobiales bacterium]
MFDKNLNAFHAEIDESIPSDLIIKNAPLSDLSTYRVGGPAALLVKVEEESSFSAILKGLAKFPVPVLIMGNGSNVLISDNGFRGIVLKLGGFFETIEIKEATVKAGAAAKLPLVARETVKFGLSGFEWAVGVPGSVGGAVRMNAGGHGSDMAASLIEVTILNLLNGSLSTVSASELQLSYRHSCIKSTDLVIDATLKLLKGNRDEGEHLLKEIVKWRRENQPGGQNSGSVFTNPEGDSAGRLIEIAGLKGLRVGSACISEKHANFIQVDEDGSAEDVRKLMSLVVKKIEEIHSITLKPETLLVGFDRDSV